MAAKLEHVGSNLYKFPEPKPQTAPNIHTEFWFERGCEAAHREKYEEALACYQESLRHNPGFDLAWNNMGYACMRLGSPSLALGYLEEAIRVNEKFPLAHRNRADCLCELGRHADALAAYKDSLDLDPKNPDTHYNLATLHQERGQDMSAIRHFQLYQRYRRGPDEPYATHARNAIKSLLRFRNPGLRLVI